MKVGPMNILNNAQHVCVQWRSITEDPLLWRVIDMNPGIRKEPLLCPSISTEPLWWRLIETRISWKFNLLIMCRHAIDRSQGNLVPISLSNFGSDDLLHYIADFSSHLRRLRLVCCVDISDEGLSEVGKKLPFLEELDLTIGYFSKDSLEAIGRCCPLLKSLKFNMQSVYGSGYAEAEVSDEEAFAIAETMPNLCHLQLFGNDLTDKGLLAILDGCPHLESLDLRKCINVELGGSLGRRCAEQIKDFLKPSDKSRDYPHVYLGIY